jgi:hypothetical protein
MVGRRGPVRGLRRRCHRSSARAWRSLVTDDPLAFWAWWATRTWGVMRLLRFMRRRTRLACLVTWTAPASKNQGVVPVD